MLKKSLYALAAASIVLASASTRAQTVKATINYPQATAGIVTNPFIQRVYVVAPSFGGPTDILSVIDSHTNVVLKNITIPAGAYLPAVNYLTGRVYVATCNSNVDPVACSVTVVDGYQNKVVDSIPVTTTQGDGLLGIAVNFQTDKIYVSNASDSVIDVINGKTNKIVSKIAVSGGEPTGLATNSFSNKLFIPLGNDVVDIYDTHTNNLIKASTVGSADSFAAVNLLTGNFFVTNALAGPSTAEVLDSIGLSLASVPVGDTPYGLDVDPVTNLAFVASTALNNITVINGVTNKAIATVPNIQATFVAVDFLHAQVYVSGSTGVTVLTEK